MDNENDVQQLDKNEKQQYKSIEVVILMISTAIICFIAGGFLTSRLSKMIVTKDETKENSELSEIEETYNYIINNYYGMIDKNKLIESAISGMIESLDDNNSVSISEDESNNFNAMLNGNYEGIGVEIGSDGTNIIILSVFKNTPASKAGILPGDIILNINEISVEGLSTLEVVNTIKEKNQNIVLKIKRDKEIITKTLQTQNVVLESVSSKIMNKNNKKIGYIYISIFAMNTYEQFNEQLQKLENEKIDSLIIDVRSNSGGHLTAATKILSLFLDSKKVIYQIQNKNGIVKYYSNGTKTQSYPLVVLVNEESASASEILASALKEQYNAILVGKKTFGKGTVQELNTTESGLQYKITTQHWLTSKGVWIEKEGIAVDHEVSLNKEFYVNPTDKNDTQLQKAIDVLK